MKTIRLILISLLIFALSSVLVYSQNGNSVSGDKINNRSLQMDNASAIQFEKHEKVSQLFKPVITGLEGLVAYAYLGADHTGGLPTGPCSFDLDDPGTITSLAPGFPGNFMSAGTWANGKWYGVEWGNGNLYEINPFDGSMNLIGASGYSIRGIAWDGTTMYGCSANYFGSINLEDASVTIIGLMGDTPMMIGLACDAAGNVYGVDAVYDNLYSINTTTGAATIIGPLGIDLAEYAQDMDYDKDNDILYLAGYVSTPSYITGALLTVNISTGAATLVGEFQNGAELDAFAIPYGVTVFPDDLGIVSISSPSSGSFLTAEEPVIVLINNFGTNAQSNFDVSFTVNGGSPVTETISATINGGEVLEYEFSSTIDL